MPARSRRSGRPSSGAAGMVDGGVTPGESIDRSDLAAYIANLASELVSLARVADLRTLAYLTDMVRIEAEQQLALLRERDDSVEDVRSS